MNDFTKEELKLIITSTSAWISDYNDYPNELLSLRDKIQSMIDNYCEHECKHEWVSLCIIDEDKLRVVGGVGYKCLQCNKKIYDRWGESVNDNQ